MILKTIERFPYYAFSADGRVFRTHLCNRGVCKEFPQPVERTQIFNKSNGYMRICLSVDGKSKHYAVHRLILEAFVGPCPPGLEGSHLNGNRVDNRLENLVWEGRSVNHQRKRQHGTYQEGERGPHAKLTNTQVSEIRKLLEVGMTFKAIAKEFNCDPMTVSRIYSRKEWACVCDRCEQYRQERDTALRERDCLSRTCDEVEKAANQTLEWTRAKWGETTVKCKAYESIFTSIRTALGTPDLPVEEIVGKVGEVVRSEEELSQQVCDVCSSDSYGWVHNRVEGRGACTCMIEAEPFQILQEALETVVKAATGEIQIAEDDAEGLAWIAETAVKALHSVLPLDYPATIHPKEDAP